MRSDTATWKRPSADNRSGLSLPISVALLFCLFVLTVAASAADLSFPPVGRVVDQADLLSPAQEETLRNKLSEHEAKTSNQVVVVTVRSLQGQSIEDFTLALGRHWAIGQADRNNGVILLVAPAARKVRIEVGYGLEGDLPDALAKTIIDREILPAFRVARFDRGIELGTDAVLAAIEGSYVASPKKGKGIPVPDWLLALLFLAFLFFDSISGFFGYSGGRGSSGSGRAGGGGGFSGGGGSFGGGGSSGGW